MAKNSGQEVVFFNTDERALSSDVNALQALGARALAESLRRLYGRNVRPTDPGGSGFAVDREIDPTTLTAPLTATVLGGLLVNPQGTQLLIDGGVLAAVVPGTGGADDSVVAVVEAPELNPGLAFVANAALHRWDIVEAEVLENVVEVSQSRDIYNPSTQTFSSTTVPKRRAGQLNYRIRQGIAGGAVPASVSGWLPIAVVLHPGATSSFDDCSIYDVRPLADDRVGNERAGTWGRQQNHAEWSYARTTNAFYGRVNIWNAPGGDPTVGALTDGSGARGEALGQVVRGQVLGGLRGEETGEVPLSAHRESGVAFVPDAFYGLWLVFPRDLPRWKKLADSPTGGRRWPAGCGGILTVGPGITQLNFGCGGLARLPNIFNDGTPYRAQLFGVVRTNSSSVLVSAESTLDGWTQYEETWEASSVSQSNPSAGALTSVFSLSRATATSSAPLPQFPVCGLKGEYRGVIDGASPGSAKQIAPTSFVVDTGLPFTIFGIFPAAADYTLLPGTDTFVRTQMLIQRPEGGNNNGLGNRGAPIPWNFSVATTGLVGSIPDTTPTLAKFRFTGLQVRL